MNTMKTKSAKTATMHIDTETMAMAPAVMANHRVSKSQI